MATHNGVPTLRRVLDAYCALRAPSGGWMLRVVDDGSTDGTDDLLAGYAARLPLRVLRQPRGGKSAALNLAVDAALSETSSDLFVFTDDDAVPEPDWLVHWAACAGSRPEYAIFGGAIRAEWPAPPPAWLLRQVPLGLGFGITACADGPVFPGLVWGANMAVRRAVFEDGHRFDAGVGPGAGSYAMGGETEFTRRVALAGVRAWFCNAALVRHLIRPHQLTRAWALERARRHGKGMRVQETVDAAPRLLGVPRWMLARYALETRRQLRARCARDPDAAFGHAWERAQLAGYCAQAWFGRRRPHILLTGASGELGGMEWRIGQDAIALASSGYRSSVALPRFVNDDRLRSALAAHRIPLRRLDPPQFLEHWRWRRVRHAAAVLTGVPRLLALRPDAVHVAFCWTTCGATLAWLAARCGLPLVLGVHNAFPKAQFTPWQERKVRAAFRAVRGVYAVSESALSHFLATYEAYLPAEARRAVIANCVDTQRFLPCPIRRAGSRLRFGIPPHALVIGSVARLAPQKRLHAVLELGAALLARFPQLYVLIAGAGPLEAELKAQARASGLAERVIFTGHVDAVEDLLPALDLHLLLSRNEGFGIATIEAMSCGVPAVATDVPGNADVLRGSAGGVLVPLDDASAALRTVAALLADPDRRDHMGAQGRAEVERKFSPQRMERELRAFYAGLLL